MERCEKSTRLNCSEAGTAVYKVDKKPLLQQLIKEHTTAVLEYAIRIGSALEKTRNDVVASHSRVGGFHPKCKT
jgi:hypothetical protein